MHPNPAFRGTPDATALGLAAARGFGILSVSADPVPLMAHVPFLVVGDHVELHLVRSNPIARQAVGPAVIAVSGPDGYVSPDWYDLPDQVPTWNYVAVHLSGQLERRPQEEIRAFVDRLSSAFEERLAPKPPWHSNKMTAEVRDRMLRTIVPFRLWIERVESTVKLGQNKPEAARIAASGRLSLGHEVAALARLMRDPPAGA